MSYNTSMQLSSSDDEKPVTRGYLKEVLKRVEKSLQEYSRAIAELKKQPQQGHGGSQSYMNTNRVAQIETQLAQMRERIQANTQTEKREETDQNTLEQETQQFSSQLSQETQRLASRLSALEQVEKREEYDQNTIERDLRQLERDFEEMERKIRDIEYKLKRL